MITDDERCHIALKLRNMAPGSDWPRYVAEACGMDASKMSGHFHTYTAQLCKRLADLIEHEPQLTCRNMSDDKRWFTCSECGAHIYGGNYDHSFVNESGIRWYTTANKPYWNYCPNCGAKVVGE